ncbi:hypothetical protein F511_46265 [Dorcoceras hygrometricum]|uniref:Uncharacterized protein n=1 Tax=Dorcoceras hygrometricum TaxID=472368 RepID=A0A2Z6ZV24_9LAMI|nr:hypothetical protein F511_46265 [Dorcoceras hygrometricum]
MTSFDTYSVDSGYTGYDDSYTAFSTDTPPYSVAAYTYGDSAVVPVDHVDSPDPFGSNPEPFVPSGPVPISNGNGESHYGIGRIPREYSARMDQSSQLPLRCKKKDSLFANGGGQIVLSHWIRSGVIRV